MRKYLALAFLTIAVLFTGCATTEKSSGSGEQGKSTGGAGGYQ
jgi:predicted small secreted protein